MSHRLIRDVIAGRKAYTTSSHTSIADAARLMKQHAIGALMVVDEGELVALAAVQDDGRAGLRHAARDCKAESAIGAGDERNAAGKIEGRSSHARILRARRREPRRIPPDQR